MTTATLIFDIGESLQTAVAITVFNSESVVANYITDGVSEPTLHR